MASEQSADLVHDAKRQKLGEAEAAAEPHMEDVAEAAPSRSQQPPMKPVLRLCEEQVGQHEVVFQYDATPMAALKEVNSVEDFRALLDQEAKICTDASCDWVRQPSTSWIAGLARELTEKQRSDLNFMQDSIKAQSRTSFMEKWEETSHFATTVLNHWFNGKSLADVLERARALGHMEPSQCGGYILEGKYIREIAAKEDIKFGGLKDMLGYLCGPDGCLSMYKVRGRHCFEQEPKRDIHIARLRPIDGQGSLNTTWTYHPPAPGKGGKEDARSAMYRGCGVPLLDDFSDIMREATGECSDVHLNQRMYLIWKFQNYVTPYHQDVHVPPHITIYNQVSGVSLFHFMPLLVGLYVSHVGRKSPEALRQVLAELDQAKVGSLGVLGPGQVALILPSGSHGVWVPSVPKNESIMEKFEVSVIRAAELFVSPLLTEYRKKLSEEDWSDMLESNEKEEEVQENFAKAQESLVDRMGISKQEWFRMVLRTWHRWQAQLIGTRSPGGSDSMSESEPPAI